MCLYNIIIYIYAKNLFVLDGSGKFGGARVRKKELLMKYYQNNDVDLEFD